MSYTGLVAVVTGCASGMGWGLSQHLAKNGAKVVGADMNAEAGETNMKQINGVFVQANVTDWASIQNVFNTAVKEYGTIDLVFPNAGVATGGFPRPLTDKDFSKPPTMVEIQVNLIGAAYTIQAALDVMRAKPDPASLPASEHEFRRKWRGKIVVTASQAAMYTLPMAPAYCASKHGVWGLIKSTAQQIDPAERITINCVGPALVATAMFNLMPSVLEDATKAGGVTPMSTIMRGFDTFLPPDVDINGRLCECHIEDTIIRLPMPYMNRHIEEVYHNHFYPEHLPKEPEPQGYLEWTVATSGSRVYYYNNVTKQSVWDKPDELKSPEEKAIDATNWKQYDSNGRKYYTTWDEPEEVKTALEALRNAPPPPSTLTPAATQPATNVALQPGGGALVLGGIGLSAVPPMPGEVRGSADQVIWYTNAEEALKAFTELLRSTGVRENWTWEQTMRHIITAPAFRALNTNQERRNAFEKYIEELKKTAAEKKQQAIERIRPAWREGLGRASERDGGGMKTWWSWERAKALLEQNYDDMWFMARDDQERRQLWEDYIGEIRRKERAREDEQRTKNLEKVRKLFESYEIGLTHSWSGARRTIEKTKEWQNDPSLQRIEPIDMLIFFEDYYKQLETDAAHLRTKQKEEKRRRVRKNREAFVGLLEELKAAGSIQHGTNWASVYPLVEKDERYQNILGQTGSTPLELFWDIVDEMDQHVEEQCRIIERVLAEKRKTVTQEITWEDFASMLESDGIPETQVKEINAKDRRDVYDTLQDRLARLAKEEKRRQEKRLKAQIDDLRYALRKVEPEIGPDATFEESTPLMAELPEWKALPNDEARLSAFDKYISRQKERQAMREADEAEAARRREREVSRRAVSDRAMSEDVRDGSPRRKDRYSSRQRSHSRSPDRRPKDEEDVEMADAKSSRKRSVSPGKRESDRRTRSRRTDEDDRHSNSRSSRRRSRDRADSRDKDDRGDRKRSRYERDRSIKRESLEPSQAASSELRYGTPPISNGMDVDVKADSKPRIANKDDGDVEEGEI